MNRIVKLEMALELALTRLEPLEPPDSRTVSAEFVAMAAVRANYDDDECMAIIIKALSAGQPLPGGET